MTNLKEIFKEIGWPYNQMDVGEVGDGYHTFNSLYEQRRVLFAALCSAYRNLAWKSRKHTDGELCFGGDWFIVGIETPAGQYTYHYENEFWDQFNVQELDVAHKWDGHTDKDVNRLLSLALTVMNNQTKPEFMEKDFTIPIDEQATAYVENDVKLIQEIYEKSQMGAEPEEENHNWVEIGRDEYADRERGKVNN